MNTNTQMSTREALLAVICDRPGITQDEMFDHPLARPIPANGLRPARQRLWLAGMIEPSSEEAWTDALANRMSDVGWRLVDGPERRGEVAGRAATRKTRNAKKKAEERAREIVDALQDPTVNRLVLEMTKGGPGSRRAIRHAEKALKQQQVEARQRAKQAERDKAANADFRRVLSTLWDARGAVAAVDQHLIEERARVAASESPRIAPDDWALALRDVHLILSSFGAMWKNIRDLGEPSQPCPACGAPRAAEHRQLGEHVIEAEAVALEEEDADIVDAEVIDG